MTGTTTRPAPLTPGRLFRGLALAEAVTWTLLLGGILLRALQPDLAIAVTIGGALHGFVFLAYGAAALLVGVDRRWRAGVVVLAVLAAVVPFATVPLERALGRRGLLAGDWRRDPDGATARRSTAWSVRWCGVRAPCWSWRSSPSSPCSRCCWWSARPGAEPYSAAGSGRSRVSSRSSSACAWSSMRGEYVPCRRSSSRCSRSASTTASRNRRKRRCGVASSGWSDPRLRSHAASARR